MKRKRIALIGAAGVIGISGLAAAQTVTPNPPGSEPSPSAAPSHQRSSSGHARQQRPSAVESLDAESGTVSAKGEPTSRRNKFVRDGSVAGITTGLGAEVGSTSTSGVSGATTGGGRSSGSSGVTSAGGSSGAAAGSSSVGAAVSHTVTGITSASQGGNAGGNASSKGGGKGKGK